ncbi:MAG: hypothetical protein DRP06_04370 [Candidatus Aenigmatarchaeota archaeon]|nr:MAG: hypothetical protein DRP06_04370 [Candidatus Aenigmarchaeota archaeon]
MLLKNFEEIKCDLKELNKYEVVVFGSYLSRTYRDLDICVIIRDKLREKIWVSGRKLLEDLFRV